MCLLRWGRYGVASPRRQSLLWILLWCDCTGARSTTAKSAPTTTAPATTAHPTTTAAVESTAAAARPTTVPPTTKAPSTTTAQPVATTDPVTTTQRDKRTPAPSTARPTATDTAAPSTARPTTTDTAAARSTAAPTCTPGKGGCPRLAVGGACADGNQCETMNCASGKCAKKVVGQSCTADGQCASGTCDRDGSGNCKAQECQAGTFKSDGKCTACPRGKYQPLPGQAKCEDCTPCAKGFELAGWSGGATGTSRGECTASANVECKVCPVGKFKNTTGPAQCTACPKGKYQDETGRCSGLATAHRAVLRWRHCLPHVHACCHAA